MKKILSVLLVICIVCSAVFMISCDKKNKDGQVDTSISAKELVKTAVEKTEGSDALSGKMSMKMSMKLMGMSVDVPLDLEIKIKNAQSDMPTAYVDMNMSIMGMEQKMTMYSENGWGYYVMDGQEYKTYLGTEDDEYTSMANSLVESLPDNILDNQKVIKNSNGTRSVKVTLTKEQFGDIYADFVEEMYASMMGGSSDISELEIDDIVITYTVASSGYLSKYEMSFNMGVNVQGINTTTTVKATMDYYEFDADKITITPPAGYQNFPEM